MTKPANSHSNVIDRLIDQSKKKNVQHNTIMMMINMTMKMDAAIGPQTMS